MVNFPCRKQSFTPTILSSNISLIYCLPLLPISSSGDKDIFSVETGEVVEFDGSDELERLSLILLWFVAVEISFSLDVRLLRSCSVSDEVVDAVIESRLVWLRLWFVSVDESDEVELEWLVFLLERILDRARVEAIGKSSMLWRLGEVTDLDFKEDGEFDICVLLDGFTKELFLWLFFSVSFGGDTELGEFADEEEDEDENESPREVSPDLLLSRVPFKGELELEDRSRGPVCPRPGPPRRGGVVEVDDVFKRFDEEGLWLGRFREGDEGGNLFD